MIKKSVRAFYRPSGSHPEQVSDPHPLVSIMAFNHSRLGALERFSRLHPEVIADEGLRVKVRNRSRMLFRAMVDSDFTELVAVLEMVPVFMDLACDQVINGRIWNDSYADPAAASRFCSLAEACLDERLAEGVGRRLRRIEGLEHDEARRYLRELSSQVQELHTVVKRHFADAYELWVTKRQLHPLQRIVWEKELACLKEKP